MTKLARTRGWATPDWAALMGVALTSMGAAVPVGAAPAGDAPRGPPPSLQDFRIQPDGTIARPSIEPAPLPGAVSPPTATPDAAPPLAVTPPVPAEPDANVAADTRVPVGPARRVEARPRTTSPLRAPQAAPGSGERETSTPAVVALPPIATTGAEPVRMPAPRSEREGTASFRQEPFDWRPWGAVMLALLVAGGYLALRRQQRGAPRRQDDAAMVPDVAGASATSAVRARSGVDTAVAGSAMPAPRLEVDFRPASAGATDDLATVSFALAVRNAGDAPARKVRMETRLFGMEGDPDALLAEFFAAPPRAPTAIASTIAPGVHAALQGQVTLPRGEVRPIRMNDRSLFVPLVAINLLYEWTDAAGTARTGQTAIAYVVGREASPPAAKMAPLRLDQGPRMYNEVGGRVHRMRRAA